MIKKMIAGVIIWVLLGLAGSVIILDMMREDNCIYRSDIIVTGLFGAVLGPVSIPSALVTKGLRALEKGDKGPCIWEKKTEDDHIRTDTE
jgi:hypothetical protein